MNVSSLTQKVHMPTIAIVLIAVVLILGVYHVAHKH